MQSSLSWRSGRQFNVSINHDIDGKCNFFSPALPWFWLLLSMTKNNLGKKGYISSCKLQAIMETSQCRDTRQELAADHRGLLFIGLFPGLRSAVFYSFIQGWCLSEWERPFCISWQSRKHLTDMLPTSQSNGSNSSMKEPSSQVYQVDNPSHHKPHHLLLVSM